MLETFTEVVKEVRRKYEGVEKLSQWQPDSCTCVYSHQYNGVGCAIGCLVTAEEAELLDIGLGMDVRDVLEDPKRGHIIGKYISADVDPIDLTYLQRWHDNAGSAQDFRNRLDEYLKDLAPA